jgi:hypothetical protein
MYPVAMEKDYGFQEDLLQVEASLGLGKEEIAKQLGVKRQTLNLWERCLFVPDWLSFEAFYSFLFRKGIRLNAIKAQLAQEDNPSSRILFHGSKSGLVGPLSLEKSAPGKDFGSGFYLGESLEQSISFVAPFPDSSAYFFAFQDKGLSQLTFSVSQEWMLSIAYFRGRLGKYESHPLIRQIIEKIHSADVIKAPIADNRMFQIIGEFIDGQITDEQCKHCLAATSLGSQYVFLSEKALASLTKLRHCYLCLPEKEACLSERNLLSGIGADKGKIARAKYKGQGLYIEEILQ